MGSALGLRVSLDRITETLPADKHPEAIGSLQRETGHTIQLLESYHPVNRYTCAVHAFCLTEHPAYLAVASWGRGDVFAGSEFINFLLIREMLSPKLPGQEMRDDYIIYFDETGFRHIGRISENARVISKWGTGHLWDHGLWEVPSTYGDDVRYFSGLEPTAARDLFMQFSESKGVTASA